MRAVGIGPIVCASASDLDHNADRIADQLSRNGFCVVEAWDAEYDTLKLVAGLFGDVQSHIRANADGIVGEGPSLYPEWNEHPGEYQGTTNDEFLPHTDGTFLDGAVLAAGELIRMGPPKLVVLQCLRAAPAGGENFLVDAQPIFDDVVTTRPDLARVLLRAGCVAFCRDDQAAFGAAVYTRSGDDRVRHRFRFDAKTYAPDWALWALSALHNDYHLDPQRTEYVDLRSRQILIVDNYRVLHGRTAFANGAASEDRKLRRAWIYDDHAEVLHNLVGEPSRHRALARYDAYRRVQHSHDRADRVRFEAGIALSERTRDALESVLGARRTTTAHA